MLKSSSEQNSAQVGAQKALQLGFSFATAVSEPNIQCDPELRTYCGSGRCPNHGKTWVCPPGCGTVEECQNRVDAFAKGIVVQTVADVPDYAEGRAVYDALQREHNLRVLKLAHLLRADGLDVLPLTTGGCIVCDSCTFPHSPCRYPEGRMHSLSAYGINVGELCTKVGLHFAFEKGKVYYTACLLLR